MNKGVFFLQQTFKRKYRKFDLAGKVGKLGLCVFVIDTQVLEIKFSRRFIGNRGDRFSKSKTEDGHQQGKKKLSEKSCFVSFGMKKSLDEHRLELMDLE